MILATAASGTSMSPLVGGLAYGVQLMVVGVFPEPLDVSPMSLIFESMVEEAPLSEAARAFNRMRSGAARFRMVLRP